VSLAVGTVPKRAPGQRGSLERRANAAIRLVRDGHLDGETALMLTVWPPRELERLEELELLEDAAFWDLIRLLKPLVR
jgi:hypothetical protein